MSEAFNFSNTAINGNTTLVARYRSTSEGGAYGGDWFRVTTSNGNRYVPATASDARIAASATAATAGGIQISLINEATGEPETILSNQVVSLELGGGWDDLTYNHAQFFDNHFALTRISGYAAGLVPSANTTMFRALNCDYTGYKYDNSQFPALTRSGGLFSRYSLNSVAGGGRMGLLNRLKKRWLALTAQDTYLQVMGSMLINHCNGWMAQVSLENTPKAGSICTQQRRTGMLAALLRLGERLTSANFAKEVA